MILLEGKKRFYFVPYEKQDKIKHWLDKDEPAFTSEERILEAEQYGI